MSVENIVAAREARVNKAIAQVRFASRSKGYTLDQNDLIALIELHGRNIMAKVIEKLKPVDLGDRLSFGTSFLFS